MEVATATKPESPQGGSSRFSVRTRIAQVRLDIGQALFDAIETPIHSIETPIHGVEASRHLFAERRKESLQGGERVREATRDLLLQQCEPILESAVANDEQARLRIRETSVEVLLVVEHAQAVTSRK